MSLDWDTVFRGQSLLCPPLTDKAIKPSFSTSPKTLSLRFDLAPGYREAERSGSMGVKSSFPYNGFKTHD